MIVRVDLVVEFDDAVIVVFRFQNGIEKVRTGERRALRERNVTTFGRQSKQGLGAIDKVRVGRVRSIEQRDRLEIGGGISGSFGASLAFVVRKDEGLIFLNRAADGAAELILAKSFRASRRAAEANGNP